MACAAPSYLARAGTPTHPDQLTHHECLSYLLANASTCQMWHFYHPGQPGVKIPITSRLNINESTALLSATLRGTGIAMAPEVMVRDALADGRLIRLFPEFEGPARPVHLLYTRDQYRTAKLRTFIEDVLAYYHASSD
ncbi:LysR substrate-binding domain-containing protein [Photobacterium sp. MCCC 1A19761]|uniref:LysR substrate-binding domain-containing protein n=1 Tax=Photobacterium sp. MCCC 1A19761 TaxID=3115000 RepID=UPI00307E404F